jgi:acetyl esterase/lipase
MTKTLTATRHCVGPLVLLVLSLGLTSPALGQSVGAVSPDVAITPDVVYGHKDGMALTFDVFKPARPNGAAVLHVVSGGWVSRWSLPTQLPAGIRDFYQQLLGRGFTVFAVRHGSSPRYVIPEIVPDVRRAVRFIRMTASRYGIDPNRMGVTGRSAGGHLSLMLGTASDAGNPASEDEVLRVSNRVAAVVAYYPPVDLDPVAGAVVTERPSKRFPALNFDLAEVPGVSPIRHVSPDDPPTLLIHGNKDELVPIAESEKIHRALQDHRVTTQFLVIEGAGHGFQGDDANRADRATVEWFVKHLAPTS